jgi:hypothetical protein
LTPVSPIGRTGTLEYSPHSKIPYSPTGGNDIFVHSPHFNQKNQYNPQASYNEIKYHESTNKNDSLYHIKKSESAIKSNGNGNAHDMSVIESESDSVLGDILRAIKPPLKNNHDNHYNSHHKNRLKSTPKKSEKNDYDSEFKNSDKFSKSFPLYLSPDTKSNNNSPIKNMESPSGRTYIEKMIAGDAKHVSVALRAYAMSVVEEEKIINMSRSENYYKPNSNPNNTPSTNINHTSDYSFRSSPYPTFSASHNPEINRSHNANSSTNFNTSPNREDYFKSLQNGEAENVNRYEYSGGHTNRFDRSRTYSEDEIIQMVQ